MDISLYLNSASRSSRHLFPTTNLLTAFFQIRWPESGHFTFPELGVVELQAPTNSAFAPSDLYLFFRERRPYQYTTFCLRFCPMELKCHPQFLLLEIIWIIIYFFELVLSVSFIAYVQRNSFIMSNKIGFAFRRRPAVHRFIEDRSLLCVQSQSLKLTTLW